MSESGHPRRGAALAAALACVGCGAGTPRLAAHWRLGDAEVRTSVDSEVARYFLERRWLGTTPRPDLDAIIGRARARIRGPEARLAPARVARETSPDLAALLLAEALLGDPGSARLRRVYEEELRASAHGRAAPFDASGYGLLFAPGWLYRSHPENGAGFERQLAVAAGMGVEAARIETDENGSVEDNARAIAEDLRRRPPGRRYVLVSASKSGPEVALALARLPPEEAARVVAWVNVAGVLGGSPLADAALVAPRCWAALALLGWRTGGLEGMRSMSTRLRRSALGELRLPGHVLVVNHVPLPLSGDVSSRARQGYEHLRALGPNDGLALTVDEIFPGGRTLVEVGLDHYMSSADIEKRTAALVRAVLREVADRGGPGGSGPRPDPEPRR